MCTIRFSHRVKPPEASIASRASCSTSAEFTVSQEFLLRGKIFQHKDGEFHCAQTCGGTGQCLHKLAGSFTGPFPCPFCPREVVEVGVRHSTVYQMIFKILKMSL